MVAHGALGQVQRLRDLAVVEPLGDELGDIALALCEPLGEGGGGLAVIGVRQRVVEGGSGAVRWPLPMSALTRSVTSDPRTIWPP